MNYWWVNQNQTYRYEIPGGFLWSPKTIKNNRKNHFYDNMEQVRSGDLIFSFVDTKIKAVGVATGPGRTAEKPDFGSAGENWQKEGWLVPAEFTELTDSIRPKDFVNELLPHLAAKYAPLKTNGDGYQHVYLASISEGFTSVLLKKIGKTASDFTNGLLENDEEKVDRAQKAIEGRTDIGPTQKQQLVLSRRGQGVFKANVRLNETEYRLTGVTDPRLLIASHIKPWSDSSDKEKLDGRNGLLLSPHADRLFDRGLISFENDGTVLVSTTLDQTTLSQWGFSKITNVGAFKPEQCTYLEYHRTERFKK
jgi:putative restriction endonuclease